METSGIVKGIYSNKAANGTLFYRFTVENDERSFGTSTADPESKFQRGDIVTFSPYKNDRGYWTAELEGVKVQKSPTPALPSARGSGKVDWETKDRIIQLQSCRNSALAQIANLLTSEAVKLPAAQAKKFDAVQNLYKELMVQYWQENEDMRNGTSEFAVEAEDSETESVDSTEAEVLWPEG